MLFRSLAAIFSGVFIAQGALAQFNSSTSINILINATSNLNDMVNMLSSTPALQDIINTSELVVGGLIKIVDLTTADISAIQNTPPFTDDVAQPIDDALKAFVGVVQITLSTIIGKHSVFEEVGVTGPILAALKLLQVTVDGFMVALIDLVPTRQSDLTADKNSLDLAVNNAISIYSQFCLAVPGLPSICVNL